MQLRTAQRGFSMLETLVAILVVVVGLLGLAGLQARAQVAELESYQRAQALVLLYDMVDKLNNNRGTGSCFALSNATTGTPWYGDTTAPGGGGAHIGTPSCAAGTTTQYNTLAVSAMTQWDGLLQGTSETKSGTSVGAMIGARGCVSYDANTEYLDYTSGANIAGTGEYTVVVSWQGMADTFTPTANCGNGQYGSETKRRSVWVTLRQGTLIAR